MRHKNVRRSMFRLLLETKLNVREILQCQESTLLPCVDVIDFLKPD